MRATGAPTTATWNPELYNNWVFSVGGNVENPIEMTLPELVEKFGTVTTVMKQQCTINGAGQRRHRAG